MLGAPTVTADSQTFVPASVSQSIVSGGQVDLPVRGGDPPETVPYSDWRSDQSIADVCTSPWLQASPVVHGGNLSDEIIALEGAAFNLNAGTVVQQTRPVVRRARSAGALYTEGLTKCQQNGPLST